ncbi:hypothetical protein J14TS2_06320 [Bacillus sp. J14TS2]|uniref:PepSY domain-containing protein n=1 Tax=Bacillus sp. J14TS2 TaxID=2807188 RepID=UPI001AFF3F18|nr:PepSY domain-containing protein [Bacillus sp. J14TS2]GIN70157.1 hypothetical protein J14TS2_06320 [Bacillus sp. J14TS2]
MRKKLFILFVAVAVIFSGAIGVAAISNPNPSDSSRSNNIPVSEKAKETALISWEEARDIALQEIDGTIQSLELDKEDGHFVYEVELIVDDHAQAELEIDAQTGVVLEFDYDAKVSNVESASYKDPIVNGSNTKSKITLDEAVSIALKDTPGTIAEIEFDSDDTEYEIKLYSGETPIELKLDSNTGKIISKEVDD